MMTKLVDLARKNKLFEIVIKAFVWIMMAIINAWYEFTGFLRCHGVLGNQYSDIKALKGKYDGKRCFIICTGPSIAVIKLKYLCRIESSVTVI